MHTRLLLVFVLVLVSIVSGCSSGADTIVFDNFSFTSPSVISSGSMPNGRRYTLENKRSQSGDFLTIIRELIDPNADTALRVQSNKNTLQQTYPQLVIHSDTTSETSCGDIVITTHMLVGSFSAGEDKDLLYFVQYFFIHKGKGYMLMYSSSRESASTTIQKSRNRLRCEL